MLVILLVLNVAKQPIVTSLLAGIVAAFVFYFKHMPHSLKEISAEVQDSVFSGLKTISITAAAAGYGAVVAATPAFQEITDFVLNLDGQSPADRRHCHHADGGSYELLLRQYGHCLSHPG